MLDAKARQESRGLRRTASLHERTQVLWCCVRSARAAIALRPQQARESPASSLEALGTSKRRRLTLFGGADSQHQVWKPKGRG